MGLTLTFAAAGLALLLTQQEPKISPPPDDPQARVRRAEAQVAYQQGVDLLYSERYAQAEENLKEALRLDPKLFLAHYALGKTYVALMQYDDAVRSYNACLNVYREAAADSKDRLMTANQYIEDRIRDQEDRKAQLQAALSTAATENERMSLKGRIDNIDAGISTMKQMRGSHVGSQEPPAEITIALGAAYLRAGKVDDAERAFNDTLRAEPKNGKAHNNLAVICLKKGEFDQAAEHVKAAEKAGVKVHPDLKKEIEAGRKSGR
jgi:Tfp pilus assembly protein PilF